MENKIQQLTDKLYAEGLQRGKEESERLINEAEEKAKRIISEAQTKADSIINDAKKRDEELASNTKKEITLASNQMISDLKQTIREFLLQASFKNDVEQNFQNPEFVASLIGIVVDKAQSGSIEVPASMESEISKYLQDRLSSEAMKGVVLRPSVSVKNGFRLEQDGGKYYINFGEQEFNLFLSDYLRPKVTKLIFGEE